MGIVVAIILSMDDHFIQTILYSNTDQKGTNTIKTQRRNEKKIERR